MPIVFFDKSPERISYFLNISVETAMDNLLRAEWDERATPHAAQGAEYGLLLPPQAPPRILGKDAGGIPANYDFSGEMTVILPSLSLPAKNEKPANFIGMRAALYFVGRVAMHEKC